MLRIPKKAGETIEVADLMPFDSWLVPEPKIIYETGWHRVVDSPHYFTDFPSLSLDAGAYPASKKSRMLGMDTPTPSREWYEFTTTCC